jgi:hypothetical protein
VFATSTACRAAVAHLFFFSVVLSGAQQRCFAPLVGDAQAQMEFYRIGA